MHAWICTQTEAYETLLDVQIPSFAYWELQKEATTFRQQSRMARQKNCARGALEGSASQWLKIKEPLLAATAQWIWGHSWWEDWGLLMKSRLWFCLLHYGEVDNLAYSVPVKNHIGSICWWWLRCLPAPYTHESDSLELIKFRSVIYTCDPIPKQFVWSSW